MKSRILLPIILPFMELFYLLLTSFIEWLEDLHTFKGTREDYEESRKRFLRYRRNRRRFYGSR